VSRRAWLIAAVIVLSWTAHDAAQGCRSPLETVTVCQRCYLELKTIPARGGVFLYAPDIKSGFIGRSFDPFQLWIVEGVYGKPFAKSAGPLDERRFEDIRKSRNVLATAVTVDKQYASKLTPFQVAKERFSVQIVKVNTSWGGTDTVTVAVCRS
jgi:hypothetical protein